MRVPGAAVRHTQPPALRKEFVTLALRRIRVKKFVQSGGAFMVVALLCIAAALISENRAVFICAGGFWLIMAIIVRGKYGQKRTPGDES